MDSQSSRNERDRREGADNDKAQSHDRKGEAENVNDDTGRPLNKEEVRRRETKPTRD